MTLRELVAKVPLRWQCVPLAVGGSFKAKPAISFQLVETDDGKMCVVLDCALRDGLEECVGQPVGKKQKDRGTAVE